MPPRSKRKYNHNNNPKKKGKTAHIPDWRMTIFYWRGTVTATKWEGTWVSSQDGLPTDQMFQSSDNSFSLHTTQNLQVHGSDRAEGGGPGPGGTFTGSYKLDNGDGLKDFSDVDHSFYICEDPPSDRPGRCPGATVAAVGDTEFGRFVSLGKLDSKVDGRFTRLTLARRYIDEFDDRGGMGPEDLARRVAASCGAPEAWAVDAPWLALAWKVPGTWPDPLVPTKEILDALEVGFEKEGKGRFVGVTPVVGVPLMH